MIVLPEAIELRRLELDGEHRHDVAVIWTDTTAAAVDRAWDG